MTTDARIHRPRLFHAPDEGWLSLVLVLFMAVSVAWSLDDAALVLGRGDWTDFLAWSAVGGVIVGFVGARAGWNRPIAHLVGAIFAALIVPLFVGSVLAPNAPLGERYVKTATACVSAFEELIIKGNPLTRETGHYLLVLGLVCWANGQFAASSVFRHGRPIGPIIVLGAILVANMSATLHDQIYFLVMFTTSAMFLLIRLHALDEQSTWVRRRIGDPSTVRTLYLRGGTIFVVLAILGSLTLTATARSAPLAGVWEDAKPLLVDVSQWLQRFIPAAPDSRNLGVPAFGQQVTVGGVWSTSDNLALTIHRTDAGANGSLYWRATTYDTFTLNGWGPSTVATAPREADAPVLAGTIDEPPTGAVRREITFTVTLADYPYKVVFSPIDPLKISRPTTLRLTAAKGSFESLEISGHEPYVVTAAIPLTEDVPGGVTKNRLRAAGQEYPGDVKTRYTELPKDALGPEATKLLQDLTTRAKAASKDNPYDFASLIVTELQGSRFQYMTNVLGVCDDDVSIVECFAKHRKGYCEYYASTMAVLLRAHGIPARLVEGFLPGSLDRVTGIEQIFGRSAHAWVEVYFPGYGWQMFDPTGGNIAQAPELPVGSVVPTASAAARASQPASSGNGRDDEGIARRPTSTSTGTSGQGPGSGPFILIAGLLLVAAFGAAFLAWRRGPRGASTPDGVYASIAGLARRFGFGPRPTQTTYEYAAALGDILPSIRPELQTVATARVEVAYGRRTLGEDRIRALRESYRRLRVGLLRLAFRRGDRKRMRGGRTP